MSERQRGNGAGAGARLNLGTKLFIGAVAAAVLGVAYTVGGYIGRTPAPTRLERADAATLALGRKVYDARCAACHGAQLQGEPNWRERKPTGRMPAPPHDDSGHTWHHPDAVLFGITKEGLVPGKFAPPGYASDMPGFAGALSDEDIWAVLTFISSRWSERAREHQARVTREAASRRQ
jgi:mono/diheme cytochrome c family protein